MKRPSQARSGGFTLLEVLIGTTISSVVLLAVAATVIGVNSVFQGNSLSKQTVEGSRVGMDYLKRTLRLAGYGLDPALAFDFNATGLPGNAKDNFVQDLTPWGTVITDDLAFRYRDPMYSRRGHVSGSGPYTLNLEVGSSFGQGFRMGQTLLLACPGGLEYFLGRLNADALATANTAALTAIPESPPLPACLTNADRPAFVLLVHEKRLRVESFGGRPYLVVRHGWAADSDFDPLVANVESFQVAYQMNRPPASSTCCVVQAAPDATEGSGTSWLLGDEDVALLPNTGPTRPTYDTQYDAVERYTAHPANIRAVRVGLTVRSSRQQPSQARELEPPPRLLNAPAPAGTDAFFRSTVETSIRVPNMTSRTFFIPDLRNPTDATSKKNVGGG